MEATGILKAKFTTQVVSEKFQKREFVLTTDSTTPYPQHVSFQLTQDKCGLLDNIQEGTELKVQFNLRGREWNSPQGVKYFNTLEAWRIESNGAIANQHEYASNNYQTAHESMNDNDDLPF